MTSLLLLLLNLSPLADLVQIALDRDPELQAAALRVRERKAGQEAALGTLDGRLELSLEHSRQRRTGPGLDGSKQSFDTEGTGLSVGWIQPLRWGSLLELSLSQSLTETNNPFQNCVPGLASDQCYEARLQLNFKQPLWRGWGEEIQLNPLHKAEVELETSRDQRELLLEARAGEFLGAVLELALAHEERKIRAQALALAKTQLEANRVRVELGRLAPVDLAVLEQGQAERQRALLQAEGLLEDKRALLERWLGQPPPSLPLPELPPWRLSPEESFKTALKMQPELRSLEASRRLLILELPLLEDLGRPRLDLGLTASQSGLDADWGGAMVGLPENETHYYSASLSFSFPPANRSAQGQLLQARHALSRIEVEAEGIKRRLRGELEAARRAHHRSATALKLADELIRLSARALQAEQDRLELGRATQLDLLRVQQELAEAQLNRLRVQAEGLRARLLLAQLTGSLLKDLALEIQTRP